MGGRVVIIDKEPFRRAALRSALGTAAAEVREVEDLGPLADRPTSDLPDLVILDLDPDCGGLNALRRLRAGPRTSVPVLALVPPGSARLRLAALRAGATEAAPRGIGPRLLQARVRSLLRLREASSDSSVEADGEAAFPPGLSEAPAAFLGPSRSAATSPARLRLVIHGASPQQGSAPTDGLADLLGAKATSLPNQRGTPGAGDVDLVVIDALGMTGDLVQGAQVLATLAELHGHHATRDAATLLLLPASAPETAALALDLGAGDVAIDPAGREEILLRSRALLGRRAAAERRRDRLRLYLRAAVTDPLTGLHNLHHARPALRRLVEEARRSRRGLALMMLDIDHFKSINDRYGHAAGDRVLIEIGRRLKEGLRPGDLLARIGGEEFLAALPATSLAEACAVAERLRQAVADRPIPIDLGRGASDIRLPLLSSAGQRSDNSAARSGPVCVRASLSIGVANATPQDLATDLAPEDILARADAALYAAKAHGRNAVVTAASDGLPALTASTRPLPSDRGSCDGATATTVGPEPRSLGRADAEPL